MDGVVTTLVSSEEWRVGASGTLHNNPYLGAVVDHRLEAEVQGWTTPAFNDSTWPTARVRAAE